MTVLEPSPAWDRLVRTVGSLGRGTEEDVAGLSAAEWAAFLDECNLHWLTPFVYRSIASHRARVAVPAAVWRDFKTMYLLSRARTRRADALLAPVLAAFNRAGIAVIVLKGMHLSTEVYGEPAARPMIDADFLLRHQDLPAATRIVESFGFRQDVPVAGAPSAAGQAIGHRHHLPTFWYPDGPPIELHHDLAAPEILPSIDIEGIWQRAGPARISGAEVMILSPEDALLHLCIHTAFNHRFAVKLLNLCDVPVAIDRWREQIDWETFWSRARVWGVERPALLTLAFVRDRFGYALPDSASAPLGRAGEDRLMGMAELQMRMKAATLARRRPPRFRPAEAIRRPGVDLLVTLRRPSTFRGRAGVVLQRAFVPRRELAEWFGLSAEPAWLFLLYPVRLAALAVRLGPHLLRFAIVRLLTGREEPEIQTMIDTERAEKEIASWLRGA